MLNREVFCPVPGVDPWHTGVLEHGKHDFLVRGLDRYAAEAGVPVSYILAPRSQTITSAEENNWLDLFRRHRTTGSVGLVYLGTDWSPTVETRMAGMVGVLTRNNILGRMLTMGELMQELRIEGDVKGTGLFLPNFVEGAPEERRRSQVSDLLLQRFKNPKAQTIVAAESMAKIAKVYGGYVRDHIAQHFVALSSDSLTV